MLKVPEFDSAQVFEMHGVRHWVRRGLGRRNTLRRFGYHAIAFAEFDLQSERVMRCFQMLKEAVHIQTWMFAEHRFGLRENIFNKSCRNDAQPNFAVDSSKCEVV